MTDARIVVDTKRCVGCGDCVSTCPFAAMEMDGTLAVVNSSCTLCGACVRACGYRAITLVRPERTKTERRQTCRDVWVVAEQTEGVLHSATYELVQEARVLADALAQEVVVVVLGSSMRTAAEEMLEYPVDRVLLADDEALAVYRAEPYTEVLAALIRQYDPAVVLGPATAIGRSWLPRVATAVKTGLTADCTRLAINREGLLEQTRPAFGGNIMATILCRDARPQMATIRPRVFAPASRSGRGGVVETVALDEAWLRSHTRHLSYRREEDAAMDITAAEVLVVGGRGLGKAEHFRMLFELADALGGAVGATRAVVDAGWIGYSHQVGQTGKTVAPRLYSACGVSGAVQHLVGMNGAETIVAINADADAPIFAVADYGVVGDVLEVIPALTRQVCLARGVA